MLTNAADTARAADAVAPMAGAQKVVIVNGSPEILDLLETALDAGHYDVVFVESTTHAYSKIKRIDRETPAADLQGLAPFAVVMDWSSLDTLLVMRLEGPNSWSGDLAVYDIATRSTRDVVATTADETKGRFSPDGRRIAYTSDASGEQEIYVRDITREPVATPPIGKGSFPTWRRDGRELFYIGPNDEMMAVDIAPGAVQPTGLPKQLFRIPLNVFTHVPFAPYDVAPDGQRFLVNLPETPTPLFYIRGVEQWLAKK